VLVVSAWSPGYWWLRRPEFRALPSVLCLWSASFRLHYRGMDRRAAEHRPRGHRLMSGRMLAGRIACSCGQAHHLAPSGAPMVDDAAC
jgi:hypothetical protein